MYLYVGFVVLKAVAMSSCIYWDTMWCRTLTVNRCYGGKCLLLHAGFFLGLLFDLEGGECSSRMSFDFLETTRRYVPEDRTLQMYF
jgi:hypothetical protein